MFLSKSVTPHSRLRASHGPCRRRLPPEGFLANITPPSGDTTLSLSQVSQRLSPNWLQSCKNAETDQKLTCYAEYVLTAFQNIAPVSCGRPTWLQDLSAPFVRPLTHPDNASERHDLR